MIPSKYCRLVENHTSGLPMSLSGQLGHEVSKMPKDTSQAEVAPRIFQDQSLLHEAQLAFLEELQMRGGSLIATSHAFQITSADLARRACLLGLMSYWQATDYASVTKSNKSLPSYIALEDCLVALTERHGTFGEEHNFLALKVGIAKLRKDEAWSLDGFQSFLKAGETLFASCRDEFGVTSVFAPWGLDALDRTSVRILRENKNLRQSLHGIADAQIELYFDHLGEYEINAGTFDAVSIARGENRSPAWISGKLLAMGLTHLAWRSLDPVLDPETRRLTLQAMDNSALAIAGLYAKKISLAIAQDADLSASERHIARLRLAAAEAVLRQVTELSVQPFTLMGVLDHLDRACHEAQIKSPDVLALSFAGHTRLHQQIHNRAYISEKTYRA
jgi:hypothetical protein